MGSSEPEKARRSRHVVDAADGAAATRLRCDGSLAVGEAAATLIGRIATDSSNFLRKVRDTWHSVRKKFGAVLFISEHHSRLQSPKSAPHILQYSASVSCPTAAHAAHARVARWMAAPPAPRRGAALTLVVVLVVVLAVPRQREELAWAAGSVAESLVYSAAAMTVGTASME